MKKKLFRNLCLAIIFLGVLGACASKPKTFTIADSVPINSLAGKTVFLEIGMAEWIQAKTPLLQAGIYKKKFSRILPEYNALEKDRVVLLRDEIADYYKNLYNTEFVFDTYPFNNNNFKVNYFSNNKNITRLSKNEPSEKTRRTIAEICAKHEAEYVVALVGQMLTIGFNRFGTSGVTLLLFDVVLFDKSGKRVSNGLTYTKATWIKPEDTARFIYLFDEAENSLKSLISAMGG